MERLADLVPRETPVLMVYGGGSIKRNGVYEAVRTAFSLPPRQTANGICHEL